MRRRRTSNIGRHTPQAKRKRLERQNETEEQRKIRLAKNREAMASKIEKETEKQRELRLSLNRLRQQNRYKKIKKLRTMTDTPTDLTQSMLESSNSMGLCSNIAAGKKCYACELENNDRIRRNRKTTAPKTDKGSSAERENQYRESEHIIRFPVEFLNSLKATGIPVHKLILNVIPTNGKYFAALQHLLEPEKPCLQDTSNELDKPKSNGTLHVENKDDSLSSLTVKPEGKEKPTIDVVNLPEEFSVKTELVEVDVKDELENDGDYEVEMELKEDEDNDSFDEQGAVIKHSKLVVVSQSSPVIGGIEIKDEVEVDPPQVIEPVITSSSPSSSKQKIVVRDISSLT